MSGHNFWDTLPGFGPDHAPMSPSKDEAFAIRPFMAPLMSVPSFHGRCNDKAGSDSKPVSSRPLGVLNNLVLMTGIGTQLSVEPEKSSPAKGISAVE